jgi:hypothetical protein
MLYTIANITTLPNYRLRLNYTDGFDVIINFEPLIAKGSVFSALADPQFFLKVALGERGRYIFWDDIDFCADALRIGEDFEQEFESLAS